jgi:chlorobactene lauroyltransferase
LIEARNHPFFEAAFLHYIEDLARKRFHAVRLSGGERLSGWDPAIPTIAYANHSNWWDGFMGFLITHRALQGQFRVMMEERHLARYRFFSRIGAFGIDRENAREGLKSLSHALALLQAERAIVWIFPQGVLRPNDVRPLDFYSGASRLALRALETRGAVRLLPVAMRYEFLQEDRPEALISIGASTILDTPTKVRDLTWRMEQEVTTLLDALCRQVANEELEGYLPLLEGGMSLNKRLDALKVRLRLLPREAFDPRNGT